MGASRVSAASGTSPNLAMWPVTGSDLDQLSPFAAASERSSFSSSWTSPKCRSAYERRERAEIGRDSVFTKHTDVRPDAHQRSTHCSTSDWDQRLPLAMWLKIAVGSQITCGPRGRGAPRQNVVQLNAHGRI